MIDHADSFNKNQQEIIVTDVDRKHGNSSLKMNVKESHQNVSIPHNAISERQIEEESSSEKGYQTMNIPTFGHGIYSGIDNHNETLTTANFLPGNNTSFGKYLTLKDQNFRPKDSKISRTSFRKMTVEESIEGGDKLAQFLSNM